MTRLIGPPDLSKSPCIRQGNIPFLVLFERDGAATAYNWAHVDSFRYDPESGISFCHGQATIGLRGCNLKPLFTALARGEIAHIYALDPQGWAIKPGLTWVETITSSPALRAEGPR